MFASDVKDSNITNKSTKTLSYFKAVSYFLKNKKDVAKGKKKEKLTDYSS